MEVARKHWLKRRTRCSCNQRSTDRRAAAADHKERGGSWRGEGKGGRSRGRSWPKQGRRKRPTPTLQSAQTRGCDVLQDSRTPFTAAAFPCLLCTLGARSQQGKGLGTILGGPACLPSAPGDRLIWPSHLGCSL